MDAINFPDCHVLQSSELATEILAEYVVVWFILL